MTRRHAISGRRTRDGQRRGVALLTVLYVLVLCALMSAALVFVERTRSRNVSGGVQGARLIAGANAGLFSVVASWEAVARLRQPLGSTVILPDAAPASGIAVRSYVTRLGPRLFSIAADARNAIDGASRRVNLLVRLPGISRPGRAALVSAADVSIGPQVRFTTDSASCGDSATAAVLVAPPATVAIDPELPVSDRPTVVHDSSAADSATFLQIGGTSWSDLALAADIRLVDQTRISPVPIASGGSCTAAATNWGDPSSLNSACATRAPVIFAAGDLTIEGGRGQGALLVDGHLLIDGPFMFSGQIVARRGIEMRADNITISGTVYAWLSRTDSDTMHALPDDVRLTGQTTLRFSRCDAWHGMASWLQPRRVHDRAWLELF